MSKNRKKRCPREHRFTRKPPTPNYRGGKQGRLHSRLSHDTQYVFRGAEEPLYQFAEAFSGTNKVDYFIFGHYHAAVDTVLPSGERLLLLKDWISSSSYICFDGKQLITENNK